MSKKSHKAFGDDEWMFSLRRFASTGVWPSEAGNRPAPRQKKWFELFQRIDKCPMQVRGQATLFGGPQKCLCGFHTPKSALSTSAPPASTPSSVSASTSAPTISRPALNLSTFTKKRFGGSISSAAKPNLNIPRRIQPGSHSLTPSASQSPAARPAPSATPPPSARPAPSAIPSPSARPPPSASPSNITSAGPSPTARPAPTSSVSTRLFVPASVITCTVHMGQSIIGGTFHINQKLQNKYV
ncbi:putative uncharacterized protein DDB_G0290521 [Triplophysa rosa]|uniref:putative uncharacterized protein DDB_G0290521 n=1 Tax=Triplophysa rosa TaxID=992332 RepID=UPI002545CE7D|nr:putative uncharacterized protein DDB_G0290521 [Triplophysa rosa]